MNSLYHIIDREGSDIPFKLNYVQKDVLENLHTRNVILKARQIGMSTFSVLYLLDACIWNKNLSAGIVSYSLEHAQYIFKRIIGYALDHIPRWLNVEIKNRSAREIIFKNGSVLRVDTTLRGGSYQLVLVSEFGKTCARNPQKAEEIITGTLPTVPKEGTSIIESTAEGSDGFFADIVNQAAQNKDGLSEYDYKLFFYPWYKEPSYTIGEIISYDISLIDYFNSLESKGIKLSDGQKYWYAAQFKFLGEKIYQEFPSTIEESFSSSSEAYFFANAIQAAYQDHRCIENNLYDSLLPVYVAMDIGVNDLTVIIFFQIAHGEIRIIDYYEDKDKGLDFYSKFLLQDKPYLYHTIFLPHDSKKRDPLDTSNSYERDFKRLFSSSNTKFHVLKRQDKQLAIAHARSNLSRCVFNTKRVKKLLDNLSKYRKKWNEALGKYTEEPLHNDSSNHADAFIYTCQASYHIESGGNISGALQKHRDAVSSRNRKIL